MLWLIKGENSYTVIGCNINKKNDKYQVWIERPTGKTLMLSESEDESFVNVIKDAIDYAIENKIPTLRL